MKKRLREAEEREEIPTNEQGNTEMEDNNSEIDGVELDNIDDLDVDIEEDDLAALEQLILDVVRGEMERVFGDEYTALEDDDIEEEPEEEPVDGDEFIDGEEEEELVEEPIKESIDEEEELVEEITANLRKSKTPQEESIDLKEDEEEEECEEGECDTNGDGMKPSRSDDEDIDEEDELSDDVRGEMKEKITESIASRQRKRHRTALNESYNNKMGRTSVSVIPAPSIKRATKSLQPLSESMISSIKSSLKPIMSQSSTKYIKHD